MKILKISLILLIFAFLSCEKESNESIDQTDHSDEKFIPTDVLVKVKGYYTIDKVFNFINLFNHEVE